jgi:hypothetical protein
MVRAKGYLEDELIGGKPPAAKWLWPVQLSSARKALKRWRYSWVSWVEFCMRGCGKRTWAREAEEFMFEAVASKRSVKSDDLWSVGISDSAVITCSSERFVQVVNKSNSPIKTPSVVTLLKFLTILLHVDPTLDNNRQISKYTKAVAG